MATTISSLREGVKGVASHMEDMAHHAEQTNASFTSMLKALLISQGAAYAFGQSFKAFIESQPAIAALKMSLSTLATSRQSLVASNIEARNQLRLIEQSAGVAKAGMEAEHARLAKTLKVSELQLKVKDTLLETSGVTKVWLAALVGGLAGARAYSVKLNQDLIEANSNLGYRFTLMQKSLEVQRLTGESFEDITAAEAALVHYGMDESATFKDNLKHVTMLKEGIGLSAQTSGMLAAVWEQLGQSFKRAADTGMDESATFKDNLKYVTMLKEGIGLSAQTSGMLAAVWERQLGQSFKRAADTLAQIVNSTSLAADEAGRLAANIAKAVGAMRVGVSSDLAAVVKLVAGYENELKKMGGEAGAFGELLTKLTKPEGMAGASVLGISNPEFLASEQASKDVLKRFGTYVNGFLEGTQGWERTLRLEALSKLFDTSADQINLMARAVKNHTADVQDNISIEERYREQVVSVGRSWATLGNKLKAVLFEAVTPLLEVLAGAIDVVTKFVGLLAEWKGTVYIVMTALVASLPFVIREIGLLTAALIKLALKARASALASLSGAAGGLFGAAGLAAWLRPVVLGMTIPITVSIGLLVGAIATLAIVFGVASARWNAMRQAQKEAAEGKTRYESGEAELLSHRMLKIFMAARRGESTEVIASHVERAMNFANSKRGTVYNGVAMTEPEVNKLKAQIASQVVGVVRRAQVTQLLSQQSFVTTPEEAKVASRQEALTEETLKSHKTLVEEYRAQNRNITRTADEQDKQRIFERERWGDADKTNFWDALKGYYGE